MSCKGLSQMRLLSGYLSINECCFCLLLGIHVPSVPYATDCTGYGLAKAVRVDKAWLIIQIAMNLVAQFGLMFNFSDLFCTFGFCIPSFSVKLAILLGPTCVDQARLFPFFLQFDILIPFGEEFFVFFGLHNQSGYLSLARLLEAFPRDSHQCRSPAWLLRLAEQHSFRYPSGSGRGGRYNRQHQHTSIASEGHIIGARSTAYSASFFNPVVLWS